MCFDFSIQQPALSMLALYAMELKFQGFRFQVSGFQPARNLETFETLKLRTEASPSPT